MKSRVISNDVNLFAEADSFEFGEAEEQWDRPPDWSKVWPWSEPYRHEVEDA